nr:RAMP superfamily CRISPR-associated protein [Sulfolobus acidocaldarius]
MTMKKSATVVVMVPVVSPVSYLVLRTYPLSNGEKLVLRCAFKPTSSISGETDDCKREAVEAIKYLFKTLTTQGIFIGGRKSIGFGLIKLRNAVVKYYEKPDLLSEKSKKLEEVL